MRAAQVETFLAGVIFAVASNFILIGSTKLITVVFTYSDVFVGFPSRVIGGFGWRSLENKAKPPKRAEPEDESKGLWKLLKPKPRPEPPSLEQVVKANNKEPAGIAGLVFWGGLKGVGEASKALRETIEALDLYVGRYLLLTTVAYIGLKFVHFKIFDPFP